MLHLTCRSFLKRQSYTLLRRSFSFSADNFGKVVTNPQYKYQIYISNAHDPYLNLSIEHFLLQKSPADSTILFLYVNSPCVVIGRNQNPWLETNLRKIKTRPAKGFITYEHEPQEVQLVRRRSGGGTVFHDHGNVNYCVICPTAGFNRDKHAEMVAGVLRTHTPRARVNERHDIVLDQGNFQEGHRPDSVDMHRIGYHHEGTSSPPLKVSGSAYKLIRLRSLHHGTCLLNSWNIDSISEYLQSPARPFLKARGVESVRSPIGNVLDEPGIGWKSLNADFQIQIAKAFAKMYNLDGETVPRLLKAGANSRSMPENGYICGYVENDARELAEIAAGIEELKVRFLRSVGSYLLTSKNSSSRWTGSMDKHPNLPFLATRLRMMIGNGHHYPRNFLPLYVLPYTTAHTPLMHEQTKHMSIYIESSNYLIVSQHRLGYSWWFALGKSPRATYLYRQTLASTWPKRISSVLCSKERLSTRSRVSKLFSVRSFIAIKIQRSRHYLHGSTGSSGT